jgi:hypothetical protein
VTVSEGIDLRSEMTWLSPFVHSTGELIPAMDGHGTFRCLGGKMMMNWGPYFRAKPHVTRSYAIHLKLKRTRSQPRASLSGDGIGSPLVEVSTASHNQEHPRGSNWFLKTGLANRGSYWAPMTIENEHPVDTCRYTYLVNWNGSMGVPFY